MCLISVCPKGTSKNIDQIRYFIENGFNSNDDGSGFAIKYNDSTSEKSEIYLSKGYFDIDKLINDISKMNLTDDDELIIHHRISTSGTDKLRNTHPFILSYDFEEMTSGFDQIINTDKPVMAHNGVFSGMSGTINNTYNDTCHFIKMYMSNPHLINDLKEDPVQFLKNYKELTGIKFNKLAFLFPDRDMLLIGEFIKDDDGYYHSHQGYKNSYWRDRGGSGFFYPNKNNNVNTRALAVVESDLSLINKFDKLEVDLIEDKRYFNVIDFDINVNINNVHHYYFYANSSKRLFEIDLFSFPIEYNLNKSSNEKVTLECVNTETPYQLEITASVLFNHYKILIKPDYIDFYFGLKSLIVNLGTRISKSKKKKYSKILNKSKLKKQDLIKLEDQKLIINTETLELFLENTIV